MDKKRIVKTVTILGIVIAVILLVWFVILYPLIDFHKKENELTEGGKKYFEKNPTYLPEEGDVSTVTLKTLLNQKYVNPLSTTYGKSSCEHNNSWVKVIRKEGKYTYYTNLECGSMKSTIDNEGPVIKLKGDSEIEIEKGSEYKDEGVASVYDDTDGKMKIEKVIVKSNVDTNTIGKYKITYTAYDSLENKSIIERTVNVVQTLNKIVKKDTDKTNIYKGMANNNYIEFSNMIFRIVGINSDGTIKIVSATPIGVVNYTDANEWLNNYFYDHLTDEAKKYIVEEEFCSSKIEEKDTNTTTKCDKKTKQKVGVLATKDYNLSLNDKGNSYLYPRNLVWTSDYSSDKLAWMVSYKMHVGSDKYINYLAMDNTYNFAVYPVINIKKNIKLKDGDGSSLKPYKFLQTKTGKTGDLINTRHSGEYVIYKGTKYRIIDGNIDGNAKVISVGTIGELETSFSYNDETNYNPKDSKNIGYYIENKVSKNIKTDIFVKKEIEVPIYSKKATYSGKKTTKKYTVKLSAPNMYEMFSGATGSNNTSYWLINSSKEVYTLYLVSNNDSIYYTNISPVQTAGVRVVGYLAKDITILSGKGTEQNPYVIEK